MDINLDPGVRLNALRLWLEKSSTREVVEYYNSIINITYPSDWENLEVVKDVLSRRD